MTRSDNGPCTMIHTVGMKSQETVTIARSAPSCNNGSHRTSHKFVTIVSNLATGKPIWVGEGRDEAAVQPWLDALSAEQKAGIRVFAMDLHRAFWNAVDNTVGLEHAAIVHDPFHVIKLARAIAITVIVDVIHVLEYLWKAAYAFHPEGSKDAESWVPQRLMWLLRGEHAKVRANLRRNAAARGLDDARGTAVRACIRYLRGARHYLAYDQALATGLPIATGVIEGACRYLVKDRMEKTGARWSLGGAEAVLRLRALRASGDFDAYWKLHLDREHAREHGARYAAGIPPLPIPALTPLLRRVK